MEREEAELAHGDQPPEEVGCMRARGHDMEVRGYSPSGERLVDPPLHDGDGAGGMPDFPARRMDTMDEQGRGGHAPSVGTRRCDPVSSTAFCIRVHRDVHHEIRKEVPGQKHVRSLPRQPSARGPTDAPSGATHIDPNEGVSRKTGSHEYGGITKRCEPMQAPGKRQKAAQLR